MHKVLISVLIVVCSTQLLFAQTDSLLKKGITNQKEGKHELAVADFSEVIKKNDAEVRAYVKKWDEYQKVSDFDRAEKGVEAPSADAAFARAYYLRGVSYSAMKKNEEAIKDFTIAIKVSPAEGGAYYERGKLIWLAGKKYDGCTDLSKARMLGDSLAKEMFDKKFCWNEAAVFYKDAMTSLKLNQYQESLNMIEQSIKLCPDSVTYCLVRGRCYIGLGKAEKAFLDFDKAIAATPNNADAYFGRGLAFYSKRKYQEAFDDMDKAIRLNSSFVDAYLYRAYTCESMNKVQSALYDYQQVQRMKPKDPFAFYKSGLLKNENGDSKGACIDFKKAEALGSAEAGDYAKSCK